MSKRLEALSSKKIMLVLVLLLCLGLRIGAALYKGDIEVSDNDARIYLEIADNLASGRGFALGKMGFDARLTAYAEPGYPLFISALFRTVAGGVQDISLVQSVLDTVTCLLVFMLAMAATGGHRLSALLSSLAYALYPPFILSTCTPMTETLAIFVAVACFYITLRSVRGPLALAALGGVVAGLLILVRASMLALPFFLALVFLARGTDWKPRLLKFVVYIASAYVVLVPWTVRNYLLFDALIPVATRGGMVFWGGTGPADGITLGGWSYPVDSKKRNLYDHPRIPDISEETFVKITSFQGKLGGMSEVDRDRALKRAAVREIREHPARFALLAVRKVFRLWLNLWHDWPASTESKAVAALNALCLLLAILGLRRCRSGLRTAIPAGDRGQRPLLQFSEFRKITLLACAYVTALAMVTNAIVRYSYPVMPLVLILAGVCVASRAPRAAAKSETTDQ